MRWHWLRTFQAAGTSTGVLRPRLDSQSLHPDLFRDLAAGTRDVEFSAVPTGTRCVAHALQSAPEQEQQWAAGPPTPGRLYQCRQGMPPKSRGVSDLRA